MAGARKYKRERPRGEEMEKEETDKRGRWTREDHS